MHILAEPFQGGRKPEIPQHRGAQFRDQGSCIAKRVGQDFVDLLHGFRENRNRRRIPLSLSDFDLSEDEQVLEVIVQLGGQPLALLLLGEIQLGGHRPQLLRALDDAIFEVLRQILQRFFCALALDDLPQQYRLAAQPGLCHRDDKLRPRRHLDAELTQFLHRNLVTLSHFREPLFILRRITISDRDAADRFSIDLDGRRIEIDSAFAGHVNGVACLHCTRRHLFA